MTREDPAPGSIRRLTAAVRHVVAFLKREQLVLLVVALATGALAAYAALAFRGAIAVVQSMAFFTPSERPLTVIAGLPWWQIAMAPAAGGLIVGLMVYWLLPGRRPQGVADVVEASALRGGHMTLRTGLVTALGSAITLGSGGSAGREGPVVHLGASIAASFARRLGLDRGQGRVILGCGVAAAIAASFNAPLAGVLFALEVVLGHYALSAFAPTVIAAVTATIISRIHLGAYPAFILPHVTIASFYELPAFAMLGLVAAVAAIVFVRAIHASQKVFDAVPVPTWIKPAIAGALVGAIALVLPQILGVGYEATDAVLQGSIAFWLLVVLALAKIVATAITLGGGAIGGVFSPSLFVGAMTGAAFGAITSFVAPDLASTQGTYALVGMGAVAGAVLGAPLSTILIMVELTGDLAFAVAVMVAVVLATVLYRRVQHYSFFTDVLARRGVRIAGGHDVGLLREQRVGDLMVVQPEWVGRNMTVEELRRRVWTAPLAALVVTPEGDGPAGLLTVADLAAAGDGEMAGDLCHPLVVVEQDDHLERAILVAEESEEEVLGVAGRQPGSIAGLIRSVDLARAYGRLLRHLRAEEHGERPDLRH